MGVVVVFWLLWCEKILGGGFVGWCMVMIDFWNYGNFVSLFNLNFLYDIFVVVRDVVNFIKGEGWDLLDVMIVYFFGGKVVFEFVKKVVLGIYGVVKFLK